MTKYLLLSLLAACTTTDTAPVAQESQTTRWQAMLNCGSVGVVVDADRDERRHLQVVVRDPAAVAWLSSHPGDAGVGTANAKHEVIISGTVTRGVFAAQDFQAVSEVGFFVEDGLTPAAHAFRDGDGLRVQLVSWATGSEVETANWWFASCR